MENIPSLDCKPSTLSVFALSASRSLYRIVDSFQSPPMSVRELLRDIRALTEVLGELTNRMGTAIDVDLHALGFTLSRCGIACTEFKEEIGKRLPYPDAGNVSSQGWARLRYMGGTIEIFRHLLSGYKSAFEVTLESTNLRRQSFVAVEIVEHHKNLIRIAKSDIEVFLESLDYKTGPKGDLDVYELQQLKEQRLGLERCLKICADFFDSIGFIELKNESEQASESDEPTAYPSGYGKGSFSTIDNYSTGDAVIFMVSTDNRTIHGSNKALGWRSRYLTGHVNDDSVQQVSKDFVLMNTEQKESFTTANNTSLTADNQDSCHPGPKYLKRYGPGSVVSK